MDWFGSTHAGIINWYVNGIVNTFTQYSSLVYVFNGSSGSDCPFYSWFLHWCDCPGGSEIIPLNMDKISRLLYKTKHAYSYYRDLFCIQISLTVLINDSIFWYTWPAVHISMNYALLTAFINDNALWYIVQAVWIVTILAVCQPPPLNIVCWTGHEPRFMK